MTEHVHDLDIGVHIEIGDESADVYGECGCGYVIDIDEINRRLNATERLKAGIDELKDACKDDPSEMGGPFVALSWVERTLEGKP